MTKSKKICGKRRINRNVLLLQVVLPVAGFTLAAGSHSAKGQDMWAGALGGGEEFSAWSATSNWSAGVPGPATSVSFLNGALAFVDSTNSFVAVGNFDYTTNWLTPLDEVIIYAYDDSLTGSGLQINGTFNWSGVSLGWGDEIALSANTAGTTQISIPTGNTNLYNAISGTVTNWGSTSWISGNVGGGIYQNVISAGNTGTFTATSNGTFSGVFLNSSSVTVTAGTGTTTFSGPFANSASVNVTSGTLALEGGDYSTNHQTGTYTLAAGTTLSMGSIAEAPSFEFTGSSSVKDNGAGGNVAFGYGNFLFDPGSTYNISGSTAITFGTVTFASTNAYLANTSSITNTGGTLVLTSNTYTTVPISGNGTSTLTVTSSGGLSVASITQGTLNDGNKVYITGSSGSSTIDTVTGAGTLTVLSGTGQLSVTTNFFFGAGSLVNNGLVTISGGGSSIGPISGTGSIVVNSTDVTAGSTMTQTMLTNNTTTFTTTGPATIGTVAGTGVLDVGSGGLSAGSLTQSIVNDGSTITLTGTSGSLGTIGYISYQGTPPGTVAITSSGGTLTLNNPSAGTVLGSLSNNANVVFDSNGSISSVTGSGTITVDSGKALTVQTINQSAVTDNGFVYIEPASYAGSSTISTVSGSGTFDVGVPNYVFQTNTYFSTGNFSQGTLTDCGNFNMTGTGTIANIGGNGALTLQSGGSLSLGNGDMTNVSLANSGLVTVTGTVTVGPVSGSSGSMTVQSGAVVYSTNTYTQGTVTNNGSLTITEGGTVGGLAGTAAIAGSGSLAINGTNTFQLALRNNSPSGSWSLTPASSQGSLSLGYNSQLDITDNTLAINYGSGSSPASTIQGYLASGYNGDAWNGVGIMSSKVASVNAAHSNNHLYAVAFANTGDAVVASKDVPGTTNTYSQTYGTNSVVIQPALVGDANLDGVVNFTDYLIFSANYNSTGTSWDEGNFNYGSGTVWADYLLLAANYNDSTSLDNAQFTAMDDFALKNGYSMKANADGLGFSLTAVPEPASISALVIGSMGLLIRRRRRAIVSP